MENYENETLQTPAEPQQEAQPVQQPEPQAEPHPQQTPTQGYYHGAGVGQRETPYGYAPYYGYQPPYQQPPQPQSSNQPWQPWQGTPAPKKEKVKKDRKLLRALVASVVTAALVVTGCAMTAGFCNQYWKEQNSLLLQNMQDKVTALQQQINNMRPSGDGAGSLEPGQNLTATQVYQQNVNSVVAITCVVRTTNNGQVMEGRSAGSGFIISKDGYIVTNHHVIDGASKITVTLADGREVAATLVGADANNDVAIIKANAYNLDPVTLGSSKAMQVGDQVVAIGNALGELSSSLTVGYVSGINRDITTDGTVMNMIQTDAAINSGNSGGPLFNARGEVIGITTAKYSGTTSSGASIEGISFAIPVDDVMGIIEDLLEFGYVKSTYLGVMVREVDPEIAAAYNLPRGVYVEDVTAGFCAQKAGVQAKDIIVELGGYQVKSMNDLSRALRAHEPGQTVTIVVWRAGQQVVLTITLDERPR